VRRNPAEDDESDCTGRRSADAFVVVDGQGRRGKPNKGVVCSCAPCVETCNDNTNVGDDGCARMVTAGWVLGRSVSASAMRMQPDE
jgi:hypothetical protein